MDHRHLGSRRGLTARFDSVHAQEWDQRNARQKQPSTHVEPRLQRGSGKSTWTRGIRAPRDT